MSPVPMTEMAPSKEARIKVTQNDGWLYGAPGEEIDVMATSPCSRHFKVQAG